MKYKEIGHAKDIDELTPIYDLTEYSDNYMKLSGSLWQYYRDEPFIGNNGNIIDAHDDLDNAPIKYKQKITIKKSTIIIFKYF